MSAPKGQRQGQVGREPPTDRQLFVGWMIRAVFGCVIFGSVSTLAADQPLTLRNVVGYGLLFGVLVATLHFCVGLYARRKAGRSRD